MTAQVGTIYMYNGKNLNCVRQLGDRLFKPEEHGFEPSCCCTACYSGYWCEYEITDTFIKLQTLHIHDKRNHYPPLNGVEISKEEYVPAYTFDESGNKVDTEIPRYFGHQTYENIDLVLNFTGKLLFADNFMPEYYHGLYLKEIYGYKTLLSFEFENGKLIEINDHSRVAMLLREMCEKEQRRPSSISWNDIEEYRGLFNKLPKEIRDNVWWR